MTALKNQREKDYESWQKRTLMSIQQSDEIKNMQDELRSKLFEDHDKNDKDDATIQSINKQVEDASKKEIQKMMDIEITKHKEEMQ